MSLNLNIIRKAAKLTVLLLLFPVIFFGQKLTGLWTGAPTNDSNTIRKDQSFEIALTEYRGKVSGYSRNEFIINDTLYYIVKRVKGTIEGDSCEVKDDEILSYNFRGKLDKGVKVIWTFRMNKQDSTWSLDGNWKTTKTKKYYSLSGKAGLKEEKDLSKSKLFPHLEELNLADDVAFYKEQKKVNAPVVKDLPVKSNDLVASNNKETKEERTTEPFKKRGSQTSDKELVIGVTTSESQKTETKSIPVTTAPKKDEPLLEKKEATEVSTISSSLKTETKSIPVATTPKKDDVAIEKKETTKASVIADPLKTETKSIQLTIAPKKDELVIEKKETTKVSTIADPLKTETKSILLTIAPKKDDIAIEKKEPTKVSTIADPLKTETKIIPVTIAPKKDDVAIEKKETTKVSTIADPLKTETKSVPVATTPKKDELVIENKETAGVSTNTNLLKTEPRKKETTVSVITSEIKKNSPSETMTVSEIKKPVLSFADPAAFAAERRSEFSQTVNFKSDSLQLALYDNGEIDGDTVSVLMNGEVIIAKLCLKASAFKKTIYIPQNTNDSIVLMLYAENLGKYPPNTGLLIIHDGEDSYQVRFTADLQTNAAVLLRRKKQ